jgi:ACS family hexuronate transporter-like MFS transporter
VGAIVAPLTVPWIAKTMGWQWAFLLTGAIGFIWLILWVFVYEIPARNTRLSPVELAYISGEAEGSAKEEDKAQPVSWLRLVSFRQTWAFVIGKFLTDPVWWFFLFWLPAFLDAQYKIKDTAIAWPVALVYLMATLGSTWGGYLPLWLMNKGWSVFRARKTSMLIYALWVIPVVFAQWLGSLNMWIAVIIIGCAMAAHQAWSANIFTTVSDMFPKKAVASVIGIGGMMGSLGGVLIAWAAGILFDKYKLLGHLKTGYYIMFFLCGFAYLLAWVIMHLLVPKPKTVAL